MDAGTYQWSAAAATLTFAPSAPLEPGVVYTVTVANTAQDEYGQTLGGYAFTFTTRERSRGLYGSGGCAPGEGGGRVVPVVAVLAAPGWLAGLRSRRGEPVPRR